MPTLTMTWLCALLVLIFSGSMAMAAPTQSFNEWLSDFRASAAQNGIPAPVLEDAFMGIEEDEQVVALDQKQPEGKITLSKYLNNTINARRIRIGRERMAEHRELLNRISQQYGVQPKYIVALWGIESDYGNNKGNFSVIQSLATLAYEGRRAEFFSKELMAALQILARENMPSSELAGSWAGAMGDCQFMPSTYQNFAADGDGDGHRDIWNNPADIFASIANYLNSLGWDKNQEWGRKVLVPDDLTTQEADIKTAQSAAHWHARGVRYADGTLLPKSDQSLYVIYPGSTEEGALAVTNNFQAILQWNRSRYFATAVGTLADAIED